eukprot:497554-Pyramimonas_sp.AAC.1
MVWRPPRRWTRSGSGTPRDAAASFVRSYGVGLADCDRSELLGGFWRQISRTFQRGNAEMLLSALGR